MWYLKPEIWEWSESQCTFRNSIIQVINAQDYTTKAFEQGQIYTTKGMSSPILHRSEEERVKLCDMKR